MIIVCQTLLKNTKILGIAIFPFIILKDKRLKNNTHPYQPRKNTPSAAAGNGHYSILPLVSR